MAKFCDTCDNLLIEKYINNELVFSCELCHILYKSKPEDSLRKERIKESAVISSKILDKALDDPATIKAYVKCIKKGCKGEIVKQVRMNDATARLYNICTQCKTQWLHN